MSHTRAYKRFVAHHTRKELRFKILKVHWKIEGNWACFVGGEGSSIIKLIRKTIRKTNKTHIGKDLLMIERHIANVLHKISIFPVVHLNICSLGFLSFRF